MAEPTLALAALAGAASFLSPCMLPVIPAFLAQLAGTSLGYADVRRRDVLASVLLFVGGFSLVFAVLGVALNAALAGVGVDALSWLSRVAGVVIIVLGLHMSGLLRLPILDREYAIKPAKVRSSYLASALFGASFAVAWTPCVGPILGGTLALAASHPASAFPLLLAYAFGLGTPFLLVGLFPARSLSFVKRHRRMAARLHVAFGIAMIGLGALVFTGTLGLLASFGILNEVLT